MCRETVFAELVVHDDYIHVQFAGELFKIEIVRLSIRLVMKLRNTDDSGDDVVPQRLNGLRITAILYKMRFDFFNQFMGVSNSAPLRKGNCVIKPKEAGEENDSGYHYQ